MKILHVLHVQTDAGGTIYFTCEHKIGQNEESIHYDQCCSHFAIRINRKEVFRKELKTFQTSIYVESFP